MSRSGYSEDVDGGELNRWRGAVASAIRGKRGQEFLRELLAALDALEPKRLIGGELVHDGEVCALGSVAVRRGLDVDRLDHRDYWRVAKVFGISRALAQEIMFENDESAYYDEAPGKRYRRVHAWVSRLIQEEAPK